MLLLMMNFPMFHSSMSSSLPGVFIDEGREERGYHAGGTNVCSDGRETRIC